MPIYEKLKKYVFANIGKTVVFNSHHDARKHFNSHSNDELFEKAQKYDTIQFVCHIENVRKHEIVFLNGKTKRKYACTENDPLFFKESPFVCDESKDTLVPL